MRAITKRPELGLLGGLLGADFILGILLVWRLPFDVPTPEYLWPAIEFGKTHRIASTFLSVGYSATIGFGYMLAGSRWGISTVDVLLSVSLVLAAWVYLRLIGMTVRQTFGLTLLLSLYPDFILSYHKVEDTNLTALLLFSFLSAVLLIGRLKRWGYADFALSFVLAAAVLVRPNLVMLLPVAWFFLYKFRVSSLVWRAAAQVVLLALLYAAFTAVVHGRAFLPRNGPYNLYAGANQFTEAHIKNPEDSLYDALAAQGIKASLSWKTQPGVPGVNDLRDPELERIYSQSAWRFVRAHPVVMLRLTWLKLVNLMRPDRHRHPPHSFGGLVKTVEALAIPLWLVATILLPHPGPRYARLLIATTVVFTLLPFLVTVSASRFREPVDLVCWMDLGAIVVSYRSKRMNQSVRAACSASAPTIADTTN